MHLHQLKVVVHRESEWISANVRSRTLISICFNGMKILQNKNRSTVFTGSYGGESYEKGIFTSNNNITRETKQHTFSPIVSRHIYNFGCARSQTRLYCVELRLTVCINVRLANCVCSAFIPSFDICFTYNAIHLLNVWITKCTIFGFSPHSFVRRSHRLLHV